MRSRLLLSLLVAPLLMAACAPGGGNRSRKIEGETVTIQVRNDLRPQTEVTLRIASSNGVRRILGSVPPGGSRKVTFEEGSFSGQYRLVAETASGQEMESRPFSLFRNAEVSWTLFNNTLRVVEP
jgi:hypothetical protein